MKTININVYSLNELSDKAYDKAYDNWQNHAYLYARDNIGALRAFEKVFDVYCFEHKYNMESYNYQFTMLHSPTIQNMSGIRLSTYIYNNYYKVLFLPKIYYTRNWTKKRNSRIFFENDCVLTGDCSSEMILKPVYDFLQNPDENVNFYTLIDKCLNNFFEFCRDDYKECCCIERFENEMQNNLFFEDGSLYLNTPL